MQPYPTSDQAFYCNIFLGWGQPNFGSFLAEKMLILGGAFACLFARQKKWSESETHLRRIWRCSTETVAIIWQASFYTAVTRGHRDSRVCTICVVTGVRPSSLFHAVLLSWNEASNRWLAPVFVRDGFRPGGFANTSAHSNASANAGAERLSIAGRIEKTAARTIARC